MRLYYVDMEVPLMPRIAKPYKLVPAEVPSLAGRGATVYADVVADFLASDLESAMIDMPGRKSQALTLGLRKAAAASGADIKVVTRASQVFLTRS